MNNIVNIPEKESETNDKMSVADSNTAGKY